jgi:hypothetical protein
MKETITPTARRVGSTGEQQMVVLNIGDSTVWVARTAETANPDDGLPLENGAVLSTDGPLYASVEAGDPDGELRILLPG